MSDVLNPSKEKILQYLLIAPSRDEKVHQGKTINEIAAAVDLSNNAVRKYLFELEKSDYVVKQTEKRNVGRPVIMYSLHKNALNVFPKVYAEFAVSLINELINELGASRTQKILSDVGKTLGKEIKINYSSEVGQSSLEQRIITLVKVFEEYGKYPTVLEDEEYYFVRNSNCLLFGIVKEHSIVCEVDQNIVEILLGSKAEKQECLKNDEPFCQYRIKKE
ncbi:MAG: helix-turn-helix transcriptional regulator [Candidatus Hodarchaeales archaeon]|jgi:predicted ArsR family transcriptional regulator